MLCELAHSFPPRVADLLERDKGLTRNFREETITDLLMASLIGLEPFGIRVDFPDEPTTGGDMDWIFAAPLEIKGGRYLTVRLQAKRAQFEKRKKNSYWQYKHLDHDAGKQAATLISAAKSKTNPIFPLYILYHPKSALEPKAGKISAIDGINLVFADLVAPVVAGGCGVASKKVEVWRPHFRPLSDILCWPAVIDGSSNQSTPADTTQFVVAGAGLPTFNLSGGFHPDLVAERLNRRVELTQKPMAGSDEVPLQARPVDEIPPSIMRAIKGETTPEDRKALMRPRVILSSGLRRHDDDFGAAAEFGRRQ